MSPYFLWDYNLSEKQVHDILHGKNEFEKQWLMARILESAKFSDVWEYLTLREVLDIFPKLKLKKAVDEELFFKFKQ